MNLDFRDEEQDSAFQRRAGALVVFQVAIGSVENGGSAKGEEGIPEKRLNYLVENHILDSEPRLELSNAQRWVDTEDMSMILL